LVYYFAGTFPEFCIQSNASNESHKLFVVVNDSDSISDGEYNDTNNSDCICKYHTLEEALRDMDHNTFINITASHIMLQSRVTVNNLNNITISGHNFPVVDCNHTGSFVCKNCSNIITNDVKWMQCGFLNQFQCTSQDLDSIGGLHFDSCTNLTIQYSTFVASSVQVCRVSGIITIENVDFSDNHTNSYSLVYYYQQIYGGLFVEQYDDRSISQLNITHCSFINVNRDSPLAQLLFVNGARMNMLISNTRFVNSINSQPAPRTYGNSMAYINISSEACYLTIRNVTFQSNNVVDDGNILSVLMNEYNSIIELHSCVFSNNTASTVALLQTRNLTINNSNFMLNYGKYYLISVQSQMSFFIDLDGVMFLNNNINSAIYYSAYNNSQYSANLLIQNCTFKNNLGTAVYLENSNLKFGKGFTLFENNTAEHGAALYLDLKSRVTFDANSTVSFSSNEARRYGGAIFCSVSADGDCYKNISDTLLVLNNNNGIQFSENAASAGGDSVYFNVQQACDESFQSLSNITLHSFGEQMITSPKKLQLGSPANLITDINATISEYLVSNIMLGHDITIPSCLLDYNEKLAGVAPFLISHIQNTPEQFFVNGSRGLSIGCNTLEGISNLQIFGRVSSNHTSNSNVIDIFDKNFTTIQLRSFYDTIYALKPIVINVIIEISADCHAGFHYNQDNTGILKCVCYTTDSVVLCVGSNATIKRGYWFGTVNGQATVSLCPVNYCNLDRCEATTTFCPLLPSPDDQCSEHRSGIACGNCKTGYTLSFDSVDCVNINECTSGYTTLIVLVTILYWILTFVMVFAVMYFKVGIGYFYSLTFYYSIIDILLGQALHNSDALYQMVTIMSSLARLTPQFLGQLCFVKGLSGIDQQYIHYIHPLAILFILLLIIMTTRFSPRLSLFVSRGVIHVICFLLLLSYTSIASTSLLLMRPLSFTGIGKAYTYLSPDIEYFNGRHLAYGLAATACCVVIVIGLPLLLILEPFINHKINFARIKPLLDQFQGYYKDKYRYFASYYMIGRLILLIIVNVNINNVYTIAYMQIAVLVIMTLIHIIVRPYAKNIINAIDGFLLLTTLMVAILQPFEASNGFNTNTVIGLSFFLVLLPLFIFIVMIIPYVNMQQIKKFMMLCVSSVKSSKRNEIPNRDIELQPTPSEVYQVTIDQDLRESISTTIV